MGARRVQRLHGRAVAALIDESHHRSPPAAPARRAPGAPRPLGAPAQAGFRLRSGSVPVRLLADAARPALCQHHARWRGHGGARLGTGVPAGSPPPVGPPDRLGARLVRRVPCVPVLYGAALPGHCPGLVRDALRGGLQAGQHRRAGCAPAGGGDLRSARRPSFPRAEPGGAVHAAVPVRHVLQHLRRERGVHPGRGVRLLHQPVADAGLPGRCAARAADGASPGAGRRLARARGPDPPDTGHLCPGGHRRGVRHASRPAQRSLADRGGSSGGHAGGVLAAAVLVVAGLLPQHRLDQPVGVLAEPGARRLELGAGAGLGRPAGRDPAPAAPGSLPGGSGGGGGGGVPVDAPGGAVERPDPALLLRVDAAAGGGGCGDPADDAGGRRAAGRCVRPAGRYRTCRCARAQAQLATGRLAAPPDRCGGRDSAGRRGGGGRRSGRRQFRPAGAAENSAGPREGHSPPAGGRGGPSGAAHSPGGCPGGACGTAEVAARAGVPP